MTKNPLPILCILLLAASPALADETLHLFAADGPGSPGSPGTGAEGFTFDDGDQPAAAGWVGVDLTTNPDTYWHVANTAICAGTGTDMSQALPFDAGDTSNDHALWCGRYEVCHWVHPSGYGLGWRQYAIVDLGAVPVDESLDIAFAYRSSIEGDVYDWFTLFVEVDGAWTSVWEDHVQLDHTFRELSFSLSAAELGGAGATTRVALHFQSDGTWCDEDGLFPTEYGAVWVDNLAIAVDGGTVFASDFEDGLVPESLSFEVEPGAGDWATLRRDVAQPEGDTPNETWFWTFFDPDLANGDYPDGVIPYGPPYMWNVIESPLISVDQNGAPYTYQEGDRVFLEYRAYIDFHESLWITLPLPGVAATTADGCRHGFYSTNTVIFPPVEHGWQTFLHEITDELLIFGYGEEIVGLTLRAAGVRDMEGIWGPPEGIHSAGPFIDDVKVWVERDVTGVETTPRISAFLGAQPNPFNPKTNLRFRLAEAGDARVAIFDLGGRRVRALSARGLAAGEHAFDWDGRDDSGRALASGVYLIRFEGGGATAQGKAVLLK